MRPDGAVFETFNPATARPWAILPDAAEDDVNRAVEAAHRAFRNPAWRG
jgi:acyl-CoA reductase-like NAD-dependent aldehyde dehydrogenase